MSNYEELKKEESAVSKLIRTIETLKGKGIEPGQLLCRTKLLKDIKIKDENGQEIDIERILKETGLDGEYNIGLRIQSALQAAKGKGTLRITGEEIEKLKEYGLIEGKINERRQSARNIVIATKDVPMYKSQEAEKVLNSIAIERTEKGERIDGE